MTDIYKGDISKLVPFAPNKTTKELGIDTRRKFVVVTNGEILSCYMDDNSDCPWFQRGDKDVSKEKEAINWSSLAYLPEEGKPEAKPVKSKSLLRPAVRKVLEQEIEYMEREAERLEKGAARVKRLREAVEGLRAVI